MNLINLMPIIIMAVFVLGFLIYLIWLPKPPTHDPSTCKECKWK